MREVQLTYKQGEVAPATTSDLVVMKHGKTLKEELSTNSLDRFSREVTVTSSMEKIVDGACDGAYENCMLKGRSLVNCVPRYAFVRTRNADSNDYKVVTDLVFTLTKGKRYFVRANIVKNTFVNGSTELYFDSATTNQHGILSYSQKTGIVSNIVTVNIDGVYRLSNKIVNHTVNGEIEITDFMILEYQEGMENWDIPYFEGLCDVKMPVVKNVGKNLFNVNGDINQKFNNLIAKLDNVLIGNGGFVANNYTYQHHGKGIILKLKPNTTYTISGRVENYGSITVHSRTQENILQNQFLDMTFSFSYTTTSTTELCFAFATNGIDTTPKARFFDVQIEESPTQTTYEDHETNILYPTSGEIALAEEMFEQGSFAYRADVAGFDRDYCVNNADSSLNNKRIRAKKLIKIKPNTTYNITVKSTNYTVGIQGFDANGLTILFDTGWEKTNHVFTTPANMYSCNMSIRNSNDSNITPSNFNDVGIQLTEVDKTVTLRSLPNGAQDTYNPLTGEYVKRVGESKEFDVAHIALPDYLTDDSCACLINLRSSALPLKRDDGNGLVVCNKLPNINWAWDSNEPYAISTVNGSFDFAIRLPNSKTGVTASDTVDQAKAKFRAWLSQNPITVQYELATPIITKVDSKGYSFAYENGYVILESGYQGQSLLPELIYSVPASKSGVLSTASKTILSHEQHLHKLENLLLRESVLMDYRLTLSLLDEM